MKRSLFTLLLSAVTIQSYAQGTDADFDRAARLVAVEHHTRSYVECASKNVGAVDDGISDAATVAAGVHTMCLQPYMLISNAMTPQGAAELKATLQPKVVEIVLTHRAAARSKRTAKPAPPKITM